MKKLVMAAAVLGAFAGTAQAQTSVTLYGIADGDLRFDHTNIGTLKSVGSGGESGSRWGIRGSEDLGGGLKANFIFEQGFDITDNSVPQGSIGGGASAGFGGSSTQPHSSTGSRLFGRTATVGLAGPFGEIRLGRGYNPLFLVQATADPFGAGFVAQVSNLYVNNTIRNDNAIYYDTPLIAGGLKVSGVYQFGESSTNTTAPSATGQAKRGNDRYGAGITYANGPIFVGVGGEQIKSNLDTYRVRSYDVAGTYDFGFLKLHAIYWKTRNDNPNNLVAFGSTVSLKEHTISGGVTVPFGAWTFLGQYSYLKDTSQSNVFNTDLGSPTAKNIGLGGALQPVEAHDPVCRLLALQPEERRRGQRVPGLQRHCRRVEQRPLHRRQSVRRHVCCLGEHQCGSRARKRRGGQPEREPVLVPVRYPSLVLKATRFDRKGALRRPFFFWRDIDPFDGASMTDAKGRARPKTFDNLLATS